MKRLIAFVTFFMFFVAGAYSQDPTFSGGKGTEDDPYQIANVKDLETLAAAVEGKAGQPNSFSGVYFKQTADITLPDLPFSQIGVRAENPDGTGKNTPFSGVYDGDYHMIYNLLCGDYEISNSQEFQTSTVGMFGVVSGKGAVIKNLFIISGRVAGNLFVGGIVASLRDSATIENCAVGTNLQVLSSIGYSGGICGTASLGAMVKKCVNFADVYSMSGNSFNAGGIVGSVEDSYVEGCANYGDIFCPRFAGGIVGGYPLNKPMREYKYYSIKSSYNAGDVTALLDGPGGIIGAWPYLEVDLAYAVENGYSYGRSFSNVNPFGPIVAVCIPKGNNQESRNTYYDLDRFVSKPVPNTPPYIHGKGKTHQEMYSDQTLALLNEGGAYLYVKDKDKINQGYPVLQWWQNFYKNHKNIYQELRKTYPDEIYTKEMKAGHLFEPNKYGNFYFVNRDKQEVRVAFKAEGMKRGDAVLIQSKATKNEGEIKVFSMHSFFKRPLTNDFLFDPDNTKINAADRWLITPEFEVKKEKPYFHWLAASEDPDYLEGYEVYVGGENDINPEAYSSLTPIFQIKEELKVEKGTEKVVNESGEEVDRIYFILHPRKIDLSAHIGKKVRIAFRDNTYNRFSLWLSEMKMGTETANEKISPQEKPLRIEVLSEHTLQASAADAGVQIFLYSVEGTLLSKSQGMLLYHASAPQICILKAVKEGVVIAVEKIQI